ncbi:MAG: S-layer homology domain-containing protein [Candidatus Gracilibacteria bacterium]|nr:S-layer homology domain-containing protein [Candidatus Gracilibacteria bacterium]
MKKIAIIAFVFGIIFSPSALAKEFPDVPREHIHYVAIDYLSEEGIIKGNPDGTFAPGGEVNRASALTLILKSAGVGLKKDISETGFSDVSSDQWFAQSVVTAKELGIVNGNPDGTFTPGAPVQRAAFLKMLLETNRFKKEKWAGESTAKDVPKDAWHAPYMTYGVKAGLVIPDKNGNVMPDKVLDRGEMAEIIYVLNIILKGSNTQFLITQAEKQMAQIEIYIGDKNINLSKRASELSVDLTQQAMKNKPEDNVVLGAAKIARAYDLLVDAFIAGLQKNPEKAKEFAEMSKAKAGEAYAANPETQPIGKHIKMRNDEILAQL